MAAEDKEKIYFASEESAIRVVCPNPDTLWSVEGGTPVVAKVRG
jgi:glutamate synthase domain-containing protein 1